MGIAESYIDKRGAAKRAVADLDNMKFIIEHTDDRIKALSDQMRADGHDGTIIEAVNRIDDSDHDGEYRDDGKIFGQSEKDITLVMRYRQAREYMDWFGPVWEKMSEAERYLLHASIVEEASCGEICDHLGIKEDAYYQRRKRAIDKLTGLLYGQ